MGAIEPTEEQLKAFMAADQNAPIVMVNLLKFRERARYEDGRADGDVTGAEAYGRYGAVASKKIEEIGGRMMWGAPREMTMIGDAAADFDAVATVFYPSRAAFLTMVSMPDYREALVHRTAGLDHQLLIQCAGAGAAGES